MPTAVLHIRRVPNYIGCARRAEVWVDGELIGRLKNGEAKDFEVSAGTHQISIKMSLKMKSPDTTVEIPENGKVCFDLNYISIDPRPLFQGRIIWLQMIPYIWLGVCTKLGFIPGWVCWALLIVGFLWGIWFDAKRIRGLGIINFKEVFTSYRLYPYSPDDQATWTTSNMTAMYFRSVIMVAFFVLMGIFVFSPRLFHKPLFGKGFYLVQNWGITLTMICLLGFMLQTILFNRKLCREYEALKTKP